MVASATDQLDKSVGADFIVEGQGGIMPQAADALKKVKEDGLVSHVTEVSGSRPR